MRLLISTLILILVSHVAGFAEADLSHRINYAAYMGDWERVASMLNSGAPASLLTYSIRRTAFYYESLKYQYHELRKLVGHEEFDRIVRLDPNLQTRFWKATDDQLNNLMLKACINGDVEPVREMLMVGVDIHSNRGLPLIRAAQKNHPDLIRILYPSGASDLDEGYALGVAAMSESVAAVRELLKLFPYSAKVKGQALKSAAIFHQKEAAHLLIAAQADYSSFFRYPASKEAIFIRSLVSE